MRKPASSSSSSARRATFQSRVRVIILILFWESIRPKILNLLGWEGVTLDNARDWFLMDTASLSAAIVSSSSSGKAAVATTTQEKTASWSMFGASSSSSSGQSAATLQTSSSKTLQSTAASAPSIVGTAAASTRNRRCRGPEANVEWPLGGCAAPTTATADQGQNYRTCGLCGQSSLAFYLTDVVQNLQTLKQSTCAATGVVYTVIAQGSESLLESEDGGGGGSPNQNACTIVLVVLSQTSEALGFSHQTTPSGLTLVPMSSAHLPYTHLRRKTLLLQLIPHLLFPWASRVVVVPPPSLTSVPWTSYAEQTLDQHQTCVSLLSMPLKQTTMGRPQKLIEMKWGVRFSFHCDTLLDGLSGDDAQSLESDELEALRHQCRAYLKEMGDSSSEVQAMETRAWFRPTQAQRLDQRLAASLLQGPLAVSLQSPRCRQFVADFSCGWLDQLQCWSHQEQVSGPYALAYMSLSTPTTDPTGDAALKNHRLIKNATTTADPTVLFVAALCSSVVQSGTPNENCPLTLATADKA